jgi:hypothetical protein
MVELGIIHRDVFIILVVLNESFEGVIYLLGSYGEMIAQYVDVANGASDPDDSDDVRERRQWMWQYIQQLRRILGKENDMTFQTKMGTGVAILQVDDLAG